MQRYKKLLNISSSHNCHLFIYTLYFNKKSEKRLKCNNDYSLQETIQKDNNIRKAPKDVYNEFKKIQQCIIEEDSNEERNKTLSNNKNLNNRFNTNNIALKIYELNKDYSLTHKELKKRSKSFKKDNINYYYNGSNNNSNNNNNNKNNKINNNNNNNNNNSRSSSSNRICKKQLKNNNKIKKSEKENLFTKMDNRIVYIPEKKKFINRIVDNVTFGVDVGQCLGLLGPNGAGKTTTISMMTGHISRTHGKVIYGHKDLNKTDLSQLSLGYCSQHNSLWNLLTVKETIQFYLNICGYPSKNIPYYTKALIEACGIENHTNKRVKEISGGTQRKLSLIIAICSSPNYLILDEPTAGMDPFTRRYMWKLIYELKKVRKTTTILTTHSTEEAEALCDRIAILIKGNLVCIDTPRSIKMNRSNRYVLEVLTDYPEDFEKIYVKKYNIFKLNFNNINNTSNKDNNNNINNFGSSSNNNNNNNKIENSYHLENSFKYQKYTVEIKPENIANIFSLLEHAKENGYIYHYNFGQYSLEQVFIDFVNNSN
jgi:ABC-type multidrug transport system ATPase subunit